MVQSAAGLRTGFPPLAGLPYYIYAAIFHRSAPCHEPYDLILETSSSHWIFIVKSPQIINFKKMTCQKTRGEKMRRYDATAHNSGSSGTLSVESQRKTREAETRVNEQNGSKD
jgi:hypothetical protein